MTWPGSEDFKKIGYYLGKIILILGFAMIPPIILGLAKGEINPVLDFGIGLEICLITGLVLNKVCFCRRGLSWSQGMIVVGLAWIAATLLGAIPMYLSGHWQSYLDACFDAMSGFSTTGLGLSKDLDHLSYAHNLWRHLMMFIGGQGAVIVALSFFLKGVAGAFKMHSGKRPDERILPNVIHTSRIVASVSFTYFLLGVLSLGAIGLSLGMSPFNAFFQGACVFMAAFNTGGFSPHSQGMLYYHSFLLEVAVIAIMILGAINFKLVMHLWSARYKEIWKNIETRTFFVTTTAAFFIVAVGLSQVNRYPKAMMLFRKGFFQLISAHTGTGLQTIYPAQFFSDWNSLGLLGIILAMGLGGAACSTAGGIKMLRVGIIFKALVEDVKRIVLPGGAAGAHRFHYIKDFFIEDKEVRGAFIITLLYLISCGLGAGVGMFYGNPLKTALFESVSASMNAGLSCGVTSVGMPSVLKLTYMFQMWAGRLEFIAVFTIWGFLVAAFKGK